MLGPRRRTDQVIDASMRPESSADDHWVTGDHFGLPIPADPAALRAGGAAFLTRAFRVSGALTAGNVVTGITRFQEVPGGSTGRKLRLRVDLGGRFQSVISAPPHRGGYSSRLGRNTKCSCKESSGKRVYGIAEWHHLRIVTRPRVLRGRDEDRRPAEIATDATAAAEGERTA